MRRRTSQAPGLPAIKPLFTDRDRARYELLRVRVEARGWDGLDYFERLEGRAVHDVLKLARRARRTGRLPADAEAILEAIPGWSWSPTAEGLDERFGALQRFLVDHTWDELEPSTVVDSIAVGRWVYYQRYKNKRGQCVPALVKRLEALPGWTWEHPRVLSPRGYRALRLRNLRLYQERSALLREYVARHSWSSLTRTTKYAGVGLGKWFIKVLELHRKGTIPRDLKIALRIVPGWKTDIPWDPTKKVQDIRSLGRPLEESSRVVAEAWLRLLREYVSEHGLSTLTARTKYRGRPIGIWVAGCRSAQHLNECPAWLVRELARIPGWTWSPQAAHFQKILASLREVLRGRGWKGLESRPVRKGVDLLDWALRQRRYYHRGKLNPVLQAALEEIPEWSWGEDVRREEVDFEGRCQAIEELIRTQGLLWPVSPVNRKLQAWRNHLRARRAKGLLSRSQVRRLEAIPGWSWDTTDEIQFDEKLARLASYVREHGWDSLTGSKIVNGFGVGRWVVQLRYRYHAGELPKDQRLKLEAIPGARQYVFTRLDPAKRRRAAALTKPQPKDVVMSVLRVAPAPMFLRDLLKACRLRSSRTRDAVGELVAHGDVVRTADGYQCAPHSRPQPARPRRPS